MVHSQITQVNTSPRSSNKCRLYTSSLPCSLSLASMNYYISAGPVVSIKLSPEPVLDLCSTYILLRLFSKSMGLQSAHP